MGRARVDFEFPRAAILWRLHEVVAGQEDIVFTPDSLSHDLNLADQIFRLSIEELEEEGYLRRRTEEVSKLSGVVEVVTFIEITRIGISTVENWTDIYYDSIVQYVKSRNIGIVNDNPDVPASDRTVTLDHNSGEYKEAVKSLEEFAKHARDSNEFAELFADPNDRNRVLSEINSGINLLKEVRVRLAAVKELLMYQLKWVAEKLPEATLGALASKALDAILKLLGGGDA